MSIKLKKGFSIVELLIVLMIMAMVTTLISSGLINTQRNFARLDKSNIITTGLSLPKYWFCESFRGVVLYHPYKPSFEGNEIAVEMHSFISPVDEFNVPQKISWNIEIKDQTNYLVLKTFMPDQEFVITSLPENSRFAYLYNSNWVDQFKPSYNRLPEGIRIFSPKGVWVETSIIRPLEAEIPAELARFGKYEY